MPPNTRTYAPDEQVDVVIVGSGPAGAVAAKRFAEENYRVVVLERGDWPDYSTSREDEPDFELFPGQEWLTRPNLRQMPGDQLIDESDSDIASLMVNAVGGSAVLYAAQWHRNMPSDFRTRSLDGVGDDWPITYEDLAPYYRRMEHDLGVSGLNGDPAFPDTDYPMPAVRLREWGQRIAQAHNRLGWHWWPGSNAIATRDYRRLNATTERGTEMQGSRENSKGTFDVTHWPDAIRMGVEVRTRSSATSIEVDSSGMASGVVYWDADGTEHCQRATVVIVAANGVGTPWLLLNSASPRHPHGLANSSGLVGKRLMMHPLSTVVGVFDDDIGSTQASWGQQAYSMQFYETDESRGFVRGAKWALSPTGGPATTTRTYPYGSDTHWGDRFHETVRERLGHAALWAIISEDLPDINNAVVLGTDTDEYGMPVPKINYRNSENTDKLLRWHEARASESMSEAGASKVIVSPAIRETGWHMLGTTVMGEDRENSVVAANGQSHDVPNLYIFGGSTWPTSSGTNPTATVAAHSLRNTELMISDRANQKVSL